MKNLKMMILPLLFLGIFSVSCSSDDDSGNGNIDVIVGNWKITDIYFNNVSIYDDLMQSENKCVLYTVTQLNNDHTVVVKRFQWDTSSTTGDCIADEDITGTWSKNEDSSYTMILDGEETILTPNFVNNNQFTSTLQIGEETYVITLTRQ